MSQPLSEDDEIVLRLTRREARALLFAHEINEFPVSNPLGEAGYDVLLAAEVKLSSALAES